MRYQSTRGHPSLVSFETAVLSGYAPDGGLYVPERVPNVDAAMLRSWHGQPYSKIAAAVLSLFVEEEIPLPDLEAITRKAFGTFAADDVLPLRQVGTAWVLEAFHGPTLSFKDVGLQVLGKLLDYLLGRSGKRANILVETSGDTGPAAIEGVRGGENVDIFVLFPGGGRISAVQELQMTTVADENVHVYRTAGNTDDQATAIKDVFRDEAFVQANNLCSINSINIARVIVQSTYYIYTYLRSVPLGDVGVASVDFAVPTGAFGNCASGLFAIMMGVPIARIVAATNSNDIVHRALSRGDFRYGDNVMTHSPAMDIQLPYNMERLLYFTCNRDGALVRRLMTRLEETGESPLDPTIVAKIRRFYTSTCVSDQDTLATIERVRREHGYCLCPHSAIGVFGAAEAEESRAATGARRTICVATAHPAKFEDAVTKATGAAPPTEASVERMKTMPQKALALEQPGGPTGPWRKQWADTLRRDIAAVASAKASERRGRGRARL